MKLSLKQFTKIKNRVEKELLGSGKDRYDAKPKFSKYAFECDYHKTYPGCTLRLYFWWRSVKGHGYVYGKRTTSVLETSPMNYCEYTLFEEDYLINIFNPPSQDKKKSAPASRIMKGGK